MTVAPIDTSAAERRALRIGLRLDAIADNYEAVMPMIREALEEGDHATLGYRSPGEYLADRFGKALSRLPIIVRREFVGELTDAGLSTRAIAAVTGTSHMTAQRDQQAGVTPVPPEPTVNTETGEVSDDYLPDDATGEEVTTSTEATDTGSDPVFLADDVEEAPGEGVEPVLSAAPSRPAVTGIDGKTYTPRERKAAPKRRPLTDQARDAGWELRKSVERIERIASDDRFTPNKEAVASHLRGHLTNAIEVCQDLLDRINTQEEGTK